MNISSNLKKTLIVLVASAFATVLHAEDAGNVPCHPTNNRSQLITTDQPFVIFKAIKGAKNPIMFKCHPGINELDVMYFGTQKKSGPKLVKDAKDLANLVPLRFSMKFADNTAVQIDKKYEGFRESYIGSGLEKLFKCLGIYPTAGYKGIALVDEYKVGLPMKFVLSNVEQFKALKQYLLKGFDAANVVVAENKPLLLLEIVDTTTKLDASDVVFLNHYYDVLDARDPAVKTFFNEASEFLGDVARETKDAKNVGELIGEMILNDASNKAKDFDGKKIRDLMITSALAAVFGCIFKQMNDRKQGAIDCVTAPVNNFVWNYLIDQTANADKDIAVSGWYKQRAKELGIGAGAVVVAYLVHRVINDMNALDDEDELPVDACVLQEEVAA